MNLNEMIKLRRSVRKYQNKPISDEILNEILEAATWAPSGVNLQPWYLVAIKSPEQMKVLQDIMIDVSEFMRPALQKRFEKHPHVIDDTTRFLRQLGGAPVCVLAFANKPDYPPKVDVVNLSIAAAIENMLLTATSHGIGSCWLTAPVEAGAGPKLQEHFAPGHGPLVSIVTFGYAETPLEMLKAPVRKSDRYTIV